MGVGGRGCEEADGDSGGGGVAALNFLCSS